MKKEATKKTAKKAEASDETDLIVVRQLPIIEEQLQAIRSQFLAVSEEAIKMDCTEETLQTVKKKRAEISKVFHALEAKRMEAKKQILAPYEAFEAIYKECVTNIYKPCDDCLAQKISDVESNLKAEKADEAKAYFNEYAKSLGIDFLAFEQAGISVTMTVSKKSLRDQSKSYLDKVAEEIQLIQTQENSEEIFLEYKKTLNVANAITLVTKRHAAIEAERRRKEEMKAAAERINEAASKVAAAIADTDEAAVKASEAIEAFTPPKEEASEIQSAEPEKIYEVAFTVRGTLPAIKALKTFLVEGGYEYDQN